MNQGLRAIEIVGGHPSIDFVNSVHNWNAEPPPDYFEGFDDLVEWHRLLDLLGERSAERFLAAPQRDKDKAFRQAIALRGHLHRIFAAVAAGRSLPQSSLDHLTDVLRRTMRWRRLEADGASGGRRLSCVWDFADAPAEALPGVVAWQAAELLEQGPLDRLKECPSERCGWLFLDSSKNRSRTWCSMKACGNAAKVRRFRKRASA